MFDGRDDQAYLHVVAAVILDQAGQVLVSQRLQDKHCAGLWEFPGGKCHKGETPQQALQRELQEELGIDVEGMRPLIKVRHVYHDGGSKQAILLDVWRLDAYQGTPVGREGQLIQWWHGDALSSLAMPAADLPVIKALRLPQHYAITPEPEQGLSHFLCAQEKKFSEGIKLLQFRAKTLQAGDYVMYAEALLKLSHKYEAKVMLNTDIETALRLSADGVHLTQAKLMALPKKPQCSDFLFAASCHDEASLLRAEALDFDFAVLSAVKPTLTHADATILGWDGFSYLCGRVNLPVFALGGLLSSDLEEALAQGAQGIAGIRLFG